MPILVIAEHDNAKLRSATAHAVGAATQLGGDCHVLIAGHGALMSYYYSGIFDNKFWENMVILGQTGRMPWVALEARADAPYRTWAELVDYAKVDSGKLIAELASTAHRRRSAQTRASPRFFRRDRGLPLSARAA